jgi:peroxiredoxin
MALTQTPKAEIGWIAPDFELIGVDGKTYDLQAARGHNGLLVMFICNHCPFVQAILDKIIRDVAELKELGIGAIAVMSNDVENYPDDSFENMRALALAKNFPFPYVYDETQIVAQRFGAVCTPDFFGFDKNMALAYRGRLDDSGMKQKDEGHRDLFEAMKAIATTGRSDKPQFNSIGCNIKWK